MVSPIINGEIAEFKQHPDCLYEEQPSTSGVKIDDRSFEDGRTVKKLLRYPHRGSYNLTNPTAPEQRRNRRKKLKKITKYVTSGVGVCFLTLTYIFI